MRMTIRRAAAAIGAALALGTGFAVWATSSASAAPSAPAALIPVCTAADLSVWPVPLHQAHKRGGSVA